MRGRARVLLSFAAVSFAFVACGAVAAPPAAAARAIAVRISPSSGPVGSSAVVSFSADPKQSCKYVDIFWDGAPLATAEEAAGSVAITIPESVPGGHKVSARNGCRIGGGTSFEVTPEPEPTPTPTPTKTVPPTPRPPTRTAPPPETPPGRPTTPPPPTDPLPTPTMSPTATPTATPSTSASPEPGDDGELVLDRPNVRPGEPLTATGSGCQPSAPVILTSDNDQIGTAMSDSAGAFVAPVQFTRLEPGRRIITASCGATLTTHVDLIVSSSTSGQAGTVVVLIFFVLIGVALLRWQYRSAVER